MDYYWSKDLSNEYYSLRGNMDKEQIFIHSLTSEFKKVIASI